MDALQAAEFQIARQRRLDSPPNPVFFECVSMFLQWFPSKHGTLHFCRHKTGRKHHVRQCFQLGLPKLSNFHFSPPRGFPGENFHFSPPWRLPKLGNFRFSPPWGLPKRGNFHFSPVGASQAKNFHFPPRGAPQAREFSLFPPVGASQAREFSLFPAVTASEAMEFSLFPPLEALQAAEFQIARQRRLDSPPNPVFFECVSMFLQWFPSKHDTLHFCRHKTGRKHHVRQCFQFPYFPNR